jgi:hypothetical protein
MKFRPTFYICDLEDRIVKETWKGLATLFHGGRLGRAGRGITDNNATCRELAVSLEADIKGAMKSPHSVVRGEPFLSFVRHFPVVESSRESDSKTKVHRVPTSRKCDSLTSDLTVRLLV